MRTIVPVPFLVRELAWGVGQETPAPSRNTPVTSRSDAAAPSLTTKVVPVTDPAPSAMPAPEMVDEALPFTVTVPLSAKDWPEFASTPLAARVPPLSVRAPMAL